MKMSLVGAAVLLSTAFVPQAFAQNCDPTDVIVTTTPIPPQSGTSLRRHLRLKALMGKKQQTVTVLLGDSLVEMWPAMDTAHVINLGDGNDRTQNVLWRLADMNLASVVPTNVVLLIGTNNFGPSDPNCSIVAGVSAILDVTQKAWPAAHTILIEIPPRGMHLQFRDADRRALNQSLRLMANRRKNVTSLNVDDAMECPDASYCDKYLPDMTHPSPAGYAILSRLMPFPLGP
jgi:lysophospholipase L1-like esterase